MRFLGAIKEAQAVGFTLAEIAEYLRAARRSGAPSEALRVRMAAKIDQIDARIAALRRMRDELARVVGCACDLARPLHLRRRLPRPPRRRRRRRGRRSFTSPTAKAPATPCGRPRSAAPCCPGRTCSTRGRCRRCRGRSCCGHAPRFLADCGWGSRPALLSSLERRDRQLLEALRDGLQVVLWFEHDLYDQLQLLDVLALAHTEEAAPELIVIGSFPGKPSFAGLGELTASELETLWPSRRRAAPAALEAATSAWAAFRAPEPTALAEWATHESAQLPFLAPALRRLLEELPAPADGLSGTERRALQAVAAGAHTPPAAFVAAQRLEEAPFLGDAWFYRALSALGQGRRGCSRPTTAHRFPRLRRSATASTSHASSCG